MKFSTILMATFATVSSALTTDLLPEKFTLEFTSLVTGAKLGYLALDKHYNAHMDPSNTEPAVVTKQSEASGGILFPLPWTDHFPYQIMKRSIDWGSVVFSTDDSGDEDWPYDFINIGDALVYDDNDGKGVQSTYYACEDISINGPLLAWYWTPSAPNCTPVSVKIIAV